MTSQTAPIDQLHVELGDRSYPIFIGNNLIESAASHIHPHLAGKKIIVVSDQNVAPLWLPKLLESFNAYPVDIESLILPASETTKSFEHFQTLLENILSFGIDRKTTIIALGGGVIGDIAGFAAAVLLRGIDFIARHARRRCLLFGRCEQTGLAELPGEIDMPPVVRIGNELINLLTALIVDKINFARVIFAK